MDWVKLFSFSGCSMGTIVTILCFLLFIFAHSGLLSAIGETDMKCKCAHMIVVDFLFFCDFLSLMLQQ